MKGKKGVLTLAFIFVVFSFIVLFIFAFLAPAGVLINTKIYAAAEDLMISSNSSVQAIQDASVREVVEGQIASSLRAQQYAIEANNNMYRYSWIFIIGLMAVMMFLFARSLVETQRII